MLHRHTLAALSILFLLLASVPNVTAQSGEGTPLWKLVPGTEGSFFDEVFFVGRTHGWITEWGTNRILRTTDGGVTWGEQFTPEGVPSSLHSLCFPTRMRGYVGGLGIWRTDDGGNTWVDVSPPFSFLDSAHYEVWFTSEDEGVFGTGSCYGDTAWFGRTTDAGNTWTLSSVVTPRFDASVGGITYANGTYHAVGGSGHHWKSTDDGRTWSATTNLVEEVWQEDISAFGASLFVPANIGNACETADSSYFGLSFDDGALWESTTRVGVSLWGVSATGPEEVWGCGDDGAVFHRTDTSGGTWYFEGCGLDPAGRLDDIFFTGPDEGWVVGDGVYHYDGTRFEPAVAERSLLICDGDSVQLSASGGRTYLWRPSTGLSDPTIADPVALPDRTTTYTVTIGTNGHCAAEIDVTVRVGEVDLEWGWTDRTAAPYEKNVTLPIKRTPTNSSEICGGGDLELFVRFDATLYYPRTVTAGEITESRISPDGDRLVTIVIEADDIDGSDSLLTRIHGDALLGESISTLLIVDSVRMTGIVTDRDRTVGELRLTDICPIDGDRLLSYRAGALKVAPNPVRSAGQVNATVDEVGEARLSIVDESGALLYEVRWQSGGSREHPETRSIDLPRTIPSGTHTLYLQTPTDRITLPLVVAR